MPSVNSKEKSSEIIVKFSDALKAASSRLKGARTDAEKQTVVTQAYEQWKPTLDAALAELDRTIKKLARDAGVEKAKFKSRIKPLKSVVDKSVMRKKDIAGFADLVVAMILVDTPEQADAVMNRMTRKMGGHLVGAESKTKESAGFLGYHGSHHIDIMLPGTGVIAEVQIMTKKLERYKSPAHDIYATYRSKATGGGDDALRKAVPAGVGHQSRMFFAKGNQKNLREWLEALLVEMLEAGKKV